MSLHSPNVVRELENRDHYTWVSLKPFVELTFSTIPTVQQLGLFTLANLTSSATNRDILKRDDLKDDVIAAALNTKEGNYGQQILQNYGNLYVPKLYALLKRQFPSLRKRE